MSSDQGEPRPRWRRNSTGGTSKAAALYMTPKAPSLRDRVLTLIEARPATPEALQARLQAEGVHHLISAIRPRCTELKAMGLVCDSGLRGLGESGRCKSVVWRATTAEERSRFAALKALAAEKGPDQ